MYTKDKPPTSVLIVGSGVFGLGTAHSLTENPIFKDTEITLLERLPFPAPDGSSIDSSRIIRPDYADELYTSLAAEAHTHWRGDFGKEGRYTESGLCIVTSDNDTDPEAKGDGDYMQRAMKNVTERLGLTIGRKEDGGQVEPLECAADVNKAVPSMDGRCGCAGYVNWTSGWADAEAGVRYLRQKTEEKKRVNFKTAEVKRLKFADDKVSGVELVSGEILTADLIVLATGAWTPKLVDLRGVASATGQAMAYLDITQEEQEKLGGNPVLLNESNGMFIIPPRGNVLKVARHGYGYANFTKIPHPEKPGEEITVSIPRTKCDDPKLQIPAEGMKVCRDYLARTNPALADRPFSNTRLCWYLDTPSGNWLIDYHPQYKNLFITTGGSGHGYKFIPIIGDRILDVVMGEDRDALGKELRQRWQWPETKAKEEHVWTNDWRGGEKGLMLEEELAKS